MERGRRTEPTNFKLWVEHSWQSASTWCNQLEQRKAEALKEGTFPGWPVTPVTFRKDTEATTALKRSLLRPHSAQGHCDSGLP